MPLSEQQVRRYARHILLPDLGGRGQERLLAASVTVELGAPAGDAPAEAAKIAALAYLAAAGVGRLQLVGKTEAAISADDIASGILYGIQDLGRPRIDAIRDRLGQINPDVTITDAAAEPGAVELALEPSLGPLSPRSGAQPSAPELYAVSDALVQGSAAAVHTLAALLWPAP